MSAPSNCAGNQSSQLAMTPRHHEVERVDARSQLIHDNMYRAPGALIIIVTFLDERLKL